MNRPTIEYNMHIVELTVTTQDSQRVYVHSSGQSSLL